MELPICTKAYSNKGDVPEVNFLVSVMRVVNEYLQEHRTFIDAMCLYCKKSGSLVQSLQRCGGCQLVSYCSRTCQKKDRSTHKYFCKEFPVVNGKNALYTSGSWNKHIAHLKKRATRLSNFEKQMPILLNPQVCNTCKESRHDSLLHCKCTIVNYCNTKCKISDPFHNHVCKELANLALYSYPMSFTFALESLPDNSLSHDQRSLCELSSLSVHIVTSSPLLDSEPWEEMMHQLPNLKQLKIVFIIQDKPVRHSFMLNRELSLLRCKDCAAKNCSITYSVHQMQYHMFFSSPKYSEPDVVVVYNNLSEMSTNDIHSEISYRNMLYSPKTVLVLMDETKEMVYEGVRFVYTAEPVDQLVSPSFNYIVQDLSQDIMRTTNSDIADMREKSYFVCLRKK